MNRGLRLLRGFVTTAFLWGMAWSVAGVVLALIIDWLGRPGADLPLVMASMQRAALLFGMIGALNGGVFALTVILGERRRSFAELSARRMTAWGLLGGVSYPLLFALNRIMDGVSMPADWFIVVPICAILGAVSAWGMLRIAQSARGGDTPSLGAGTHEFTSKVPDAEQVAR